MELNIGQDCAGVDWKAVSEILKCVDMAYHEPDTHNKAFEASHTTVFLDPTILFYGEIKTRNVIFSILIGLLALPWATAIL